MYFFVVELSANFQYQLEENWHDMTKNLSILIQSIYSKKSNLRKCPHKVINYNQLQCLDFVFEGVGRPSISVTSGQAGDCITSCNRSQHPHTQQTPPRGVKHQTTNNL